MNQTNAALLLTFTLLANVANASTMGPGPVGFDEAAACYNPLTGEIIVSVNDIETWSVRSASNSMTGVPPVFPAIPNVANSDNDNRIGQTVFSGAFTYFDHNFGPVAAKGLPLSDLTLNYVYAFNQLSVTVPVKLRVPEPAGLTLMLISVMLLVGRTRKS